MLEGVAAIWCARSARFPQLWSSTHEVSQANDWRVRRRLARRHNVRNARTVFNGAL